MAFTKAKIVMAGLAVTAVCIVAPQQLKAQVPEAQMDGVMGQSIEDETVYESKPDLDTLIEKNAPVFGNRTSLKKASSYSSAFLNASLRRPVIIPAQPIITKRTMRMMNWSTELMYRTGRRMQH